MSEKRWEPEIKQLDSSRGPVEITVTQPEDPAYILLMDPDVSSTPVPGAFRDYCYICRDPEFAQMGLPLCKLCPVCKTGHVAADEIECDDCGADIQEYYAELDRAQCAAEGHIWKDYPSHMVMHTKPGGGWEERPSEPYTACTRCGERQP